jgi:hypothetical protein
MAYQIVSGEISAGTLYIVSGEQSVDYNSVTYNTGEKFRGIPGVIVFTYSGSGTQEVTELTEFKGFSVEYTPDGNDILTYPENIAITGLSIEFSLNENEKIVLEKTEIRGFSLELVDYPFFAFAVIETRL